LTGKAFTSTDNATLIKCSCVWLLLDMENETFESIAILAQGWANYCPRVHFVLPHGSHTCIDIHISNLCWSNYID